jgi:hypothetical protein
MWSVWRATAAGAMLAFTIAVPALALTSWMSESALNLTFSGKTIEGHYADGGTFVERYDGDGRLNYKDARRETFGRWSVQSGTFCTIYDLDPSGGCYRVTQVSDNCFEFYFAARTVEQAQEGPSDKPSWTARGWIRGQASTCTENVGV